MTFCRISAPREFAVPSVGALLTDSERSGVTRQIQSESQRTRLKAQLHHIGGNSKCRLLSILARGAMR